MGREISIQSMVTLPRLNGAEAAALAERLVTQADAEKGEGLPVFLARPLERVVSAAGALKGVLQPKEAVESGVRTAADRAVDDAWRGLSVWLGAMAGMPDGASEDLPALRKLNEMLFGDGLSFIILSYQEEWVQSETRLQAVDAGDYGSVIERAGGAPFLAAVRETHANYGEVLGITAPVQAEESPEVRSRMLDLTASLRTYVAKVAAYADPEEPGSEALSQALLRPLVQWRSPRSNRTADTDDASPDSPPEIADAVNL